MPVRISQNTCRMLFRCSKSHSCPFFWTKTVDINPNGRSYASGAEDGYVRLHIFDKDYLDMKDNVPEEDEVEEEEKVEAE